MLCVGLAFTLPWLAEADGDGRRDYGCRDSGRAVGKRALASRGGLGRHWHAEVGSWVPPSARPALHLRVRCGLWLVVFLVFVMALVGTFARRSSWSSSASAQLSRHGRCSWLLAAMGLRVLVMVGAKCAPASLRSSSWLSWWGSRDVGLHVRMRTGMLGHVIIVISVDQHLASETPKTRSAQEEPR